MGGRAANQQRRQPTAGAELDIDVNYFQEWAVYVTALFGVAGVGTGVLWILFGVVDEPILEPDGFEALFGLVAAQIILFAMLLVVAVTGVFLGAWLGRKLETGEQEALVIAGGSVAGGAAVFFLLISVFLSVGLDDLSANFVGILVSTILTAMLAGVTAGGGAAVTQNLAPRDL